MAGYAQQGCATRDRPGAAAGQIGKAEADAARNEIKRRLLATRNETQTAGTSASKPWESLAALLIVPVLAIPLYAKFGSPMLPDVPLKQRLEKAAENKDYDALVARVEQHLASNPDDAQGWMVLVPAYRAMGRYADGAEAIAAMMRLTGRDANKLADYAELLTLANGELVSADAARALEEALKLTPGHPKASFYMAVAKKQEGKPDEAKAMLETLLASAPAGAGWKPMVEQELASLSSRPPALSAEQMKEGAAMKTEDRNAMIRGMVEGLEKRLGEQADDPEGWQRLIRARTVMNEPDKAEAAYTRAKVVFKDRPDVLASLAALAKELSLE
ncbi:MAG: c-type cytochrome biogenesis protein CcmI [Rhizobiales bacterium]|nr:c-type cytochrome biogenesis protein CcmI [Hyphomicrobiales bacterium]